MAARIRKLCPHCDEILAPRTYREHIRLYYDTDSHTWTKKRKTGCQWNELLPHTAAVGLSDEDSLLNVSYSYYYIYMCYYVVCIICRRLQTQLIRVLQALWIH